MDLTINFVWIGPGSLGWLEKFLVYSWWSVGCDVHIYTHKPSSQTPHNNASIGLPDSVCTIHDLPTIMTEDAEKPIGQQTRDVLTVWYRTAFSRDEWRIPTFNMVDLSKSYIGMQKVGVVFDLKVGPSPHIKQYVDEGLFNDHFVSYKRCNTVENQCMGSIMSVEVDNARHKYGLGFEQALFTKGPQHGDKLPGSMPISLGSEWFPVATAAHNKALGKKTKFSTTGSPNGLQGEWFDIGRDGRKRHEREGIEGATFQGIDSSDNGEYYGPIRIFKNEWDQTNKFNNPNPTTQEQRKAEVQRAYNDIKPLAKQIGRDLDLTKCLLSPEVSNAMGFKRF